MLLLASNVWNITSAYEELQIDRYICRNIKINFVCLCQGTVDDPCPLITARKRSLRRLCFYTCLSFCLWGGGCYPSMHCRWYPSMPCSRSPGEVGSPGPHPRGKLRGIWSVTHSQGGSWEGSGPDPQPRGKLRGMGVSAQGGTCSRGGACSRWVQRPPHDGYCCGRYASYWNVFLLKCVAVYFLDKPCNVHRINFEHTRCVSLGWCMLT